MQQKLFYQFVIWLIELDVDKALGSWISVIDGSHGSVVATCGLEQQHDSQYNQVEHFLKRGKK